MIERATLLSSGYCALDVICYGNEVGHHGGGTAANVAANAAHLGMRTAFAGRLGDDAPGDRVTQELEAAGVDTALIERDASVQTPVVLHEATPPTHRFRFSCPRCQRAFPKHRPITNRHMSETVLPGIADHPPGIFFFDRASAPSVGLAERLRRAGAVVVFEPSARGDASRSARAAQAAHLIKWSRDRRNRLRPEIFDARAGQWQIETTGSAGLGVRLGIAAWTEVAALGVDAVDPAGAGDWLSAALLAGLGMGLLEASPAEMVTALMRGQAIAALSCRAVGARALAAQPRLAVERDRDALLRGMPVPNPRAMPLSRAFRPETCELCLAPLIVPGAGTPDATTPSRAVARVCVGPPSSVAAARN